MSKIISLEQIVGTKVNYQSKKFAPEQVVAQYIRFYELTSHGRFQMYDVDIKHATIREWHGTTAELPPEVAALDDGQSGQKFVGGMTFDERQAANPKVKRVRAWGGV